MPELDPFDARLEHAVHAFADRAQTSVDAAAMAGRAVGHRRTGPGSVMGRAVAIPVPLLIATLLLAGLVGWSLTGGGPLPFRVWLGPVATPTPEPTAVPTPSPTPTIAPDAPAFVTGTGSTTLLAAGETTAGPGGISTTRNVALQVTTEMDDPRVTGSGTYRLDVEASGSVGFVSGTLRLVTPDGTWAGSCAGASPDGIGSGDLSCWLAGSGAYAGLTCYLSHRFGGSAPDALQGVILASEQPSPLTGGA